jgi:peptide deformylase
MATSKIHLFPDPILRKSAVKVTDFSGSLRNILKNMAQIMEKQPAGIGIAAPQLGMGIQAAIVDVSPRVTGAKRHYLINPVILEMREPVLSREGCMSLPEYSAYLKRYDWVHVRWQDEEGKFHDYDAKGIEAICIQHEVDHLQGILFIDRVASLKTDMIPRQSYKTKRGSLGR